MIVKGCWWRGGGGREGGEGAWLAGGWLVSDRVQNWQGNFFCVREVVCVCICICTHTKREREKEEEEEEEVLLTAYNK